MTYLPHTLILSDFNIPPLPKRGLLDKKTKIKNVGGKWSHKPKRPDGYLQEKTF